jgi:hypothetical protein
MSCSYDVHVTGVEIASSVLATALTMVGLLAHMMDCSRKQAISRILLFANPGALRPGLLQSESCAKTLRAIHTFEVFSKRGLLVNRGLHVIGASCRARLGSAQYSLVPSSS